MIREQSPYNTYSSVARSKCAMNSFNNCRVNTDLLATYQRKEKRALSRNCSHHTDCSEVRKVSSGRAINSCNNGSRAYGQLLATNQRKERTLSAQFSHQTHSSSLREASSSHTVDSFNRDKLADSSQ